ncbi:hypothetical protein DPMN_121187 [Dreissena polymorpha]|uniref:Secreted protein n=1 Tax=Dreissena polymorpha TaxID=45954 RepID=A0A9D4GT25_DREPO|nr:hypothetical protein DPMN_121187 [Dreissena polymorpha]
MSVLLCDLLCLYSKCSLVEPKSTSPLWEDLGCSLFISGFSSKDADLPCKSPPRKPTSSCLKDRGCLPRKPTSSCLKDRGCLLLKPTSSSLKDRGCLLWKPTSSSFKDRGCLLWKPTSSSFNVKINVKILSSSRGLNPRTPEW